MILPLSEAIALGRTLVHPVSGFVISHDGLSGCALGMGYKAAGGEVLCTFEEVSLGIVHSLGMDAPIKMWPWLGQLREAPCECGLGPYNNGAQVIAHLFDIHVMETQPPFGHPSYIKPWTLDELIDWIRSVEPEQSERREDGQPSNASVVAAESEAR